MTLPSGVPGYSDAFESWLDPAHTAVLEIDMHRGHVGEDDRLTLAVPRAKERAPAHNRFQAECRSVGIPIIHVQHWQRHGGIDDLNNRKHNRMANWRVLYYLYVDDNEMMDEHSWRETKWLDLITEEEEGDYYIRTKKRLSAFYPTDLEFLLQNLDIHNVVLTGTMTDACVLSTAFDAANRDFRVIVPRDIVGFSEEAEHGALQVISLHLGLVRTPALLKEYFARAGPSSRRIWLGSATSTRSPACSRSPRSRPLGPGPRDSNGKEETPMASDRKAIWGDEPKPLMPYSPAIKAGGWVFFAGQLASDFKDGLAPRQVVTGATPMSTTSSNCSHGSCCRTSRRPPPQQASTSRKTSSGSISGSHHRSRRWKSSPTGTPGPASLSLPISTHETSSSSNRGPPPPEWESVRPACW